MVMKARKVRIVTNTPGPAPKATMSAEIQGQGSIPYGEAKEVKIPTKIET